MQRPILIIEDDPDISESLKYNFEREGWAAVTAVDRRSRIDGGAERTRAAVADNFGSHVAGHERH